MEEVPNSHKSLSVRFIGKIASAWRTAVEGDKRLHSRLYARCPRLMRWGGWAVRGLYGWLISPAFAVFLALLLVSLVLSGVVTIIVSASVFSAWVVVVLSFARAEWVNKLPIGERVIVVLIVGGMIGIVANRYVKWVLIHYAQNQVVVKQEPPPIVKGNNDNLDQLAMNRLKGLFDQEIDKLKEVPVKPSNHKTAPKEKPDAGLVAFYNIGRSSVSVALTNLSKTEVLYAPYMNSVIWDIDAEDMNNPLQVPSRTFKDDWIRPGAYLGAYSITDSPAEHRAKKGDRLFGYVIVECPMCKENKIYWVYDKLGEDGWYAESRAVPSFGKIEQQLSAIKSDTDAFLATFPGDKVPIKDYPF